MASRQRLAAAKTIKTKKVRASKVAQFLADIKHFGDEPIVQGKILSGLELLRALNWYNYMCTKTDARDYIETYLKNTGRLKELKQHRAIPDVWVNIQAGWLARIMSRGGRINIDRFNDLVKGSIQHAVKETSTTVVKRDDIPKFDEKTSNLIGELDGLIDDKGYTFDVYDWLTKKQVTPATARKIKDFFKPIADEAVELQKTKCKQLIEGYSHLTKPQIKARTVFYTQLIQACDRFADVAKKQRTPRKKKVVSIDKKLKTFKFQKESKEYKIASVDPSKIVGSNELWAFNTKYKTFTVFRSPDGGFLDIKGTTIVNYDVEQSKSYRMGRNTETQLQTVLSSTKRSLPKFLVTLKTCNLQHRSGENTILLKVL